MNTAGAAIATSADDGNECRAKPCIAKKFAELVFNLADIHGADRREQSVDGTFLVMSEGIPLYRDVRRLGCNDPQFLKSFWPDALPLAQDESECGDVMAHCDLSS